MSPVQAVKVNSLGKWKTALQMVAMSGMLLLHRPENVLGVDHRALEHLQWATYACLLLLWAGAFLSVGSSHAFVFRTTPVLLSVIHMRQESDSGAAILLKHSRDIFSRHVCRGQSCVV